MRTYATYSIKGGVGKTSAAVVLAHLAATGGARTLLWDLDPQGGATWLLRVRPRVKGGAAGLVGKGAELLAHVKGSDTDGLDVLPADFRQRGLDVTLSGTKRPTRTLARLLDGVRDDYDVVVLDCPPSVSLLSENVVHAADTLLVPLVPSPLSVRTLEQLTGFLADLTRPTADILGFCSMVDGRRALHRDTVAALQSATVPGARVAATAIPAASAVEQMAVRRSPLTAYAPSSPAARAYRALWAEVQPTR